jgi:hypothetical protein
VALSCDLNFVTRCLVELLVEGGNLTIIPCVHKIRANMNNMRDQYLTFLNIINIKLVCPSFN